MATMRAALMALVALVASPTLAFYSANSGVVELTSKNFKSEVPANLRAARAG